ncbi:MAG: MarC family protein [Planctomycetia bacterium]|nr:MarC family protein [Planctomycetia bacterium]
MNDAVVFIVIVWLKFFFLFTPFFALSMFLSMTRGHTETQRRKLAVRIVGAVSVVCFVLYFFGNIIFALFGVTVDAFRVGAGALLFLAAVALVQATPAMSQPDPEEDIAVVPLAVPIIVGPATTGALLVLGSEFDQIHLRALGGAALLLAILAVGVILCLGASIERAVGKRGLNILSKITGLILAALAAQMILTGVQNFLVTSTNAPESRVQIQSPEASPAARAGEAHR